MDLYYDTEFSESAAGIELISIGMVTDNGSTFYAESCSFDLRNCNKFVREKVIPKLEMIQQPIAGQTFRNGERRSFRVHGPDHFIAAQLEDFLLQVAPDQHKSQTNRLFGYYADYDHVILSRLFGRMLDLPPSLPMYTTDLKQMMDERGLTKQWKDKYCPDPEDEHNALADAKWNRQLHKKIEAAHPFKRGA